MLHKSKLVEFEMADMKLISKQQTSFQIKSWFLNEALKIMQNNITS